MITFALVKTWPEDLASELAKAQVSAVGDMPPPSNFGLEPPPAFGIRAGGWRCVRAVGFPGEDERS